jgi:peroxiredoxin Q/BCP
VVALADLARATALFRPQSRLRALRGGDAVPKNWSETERSNIMKLEEGDKAPDFNAITTDGSTLKLSDLKGKHVVLYFYPKDDTPGCTKEACGFRDNNKAIEKSGAIVLGVSTDSPKSHQKFTEKFKLPFPLLADEDHAIVNAYDVWGEKTFMGRKYMGTHRVTFLIDPDGRIKKIWPKVSPDEHAKEVLEALKT